MGATVAGRSMPRRKDDAKRDDTPVRVDSAVVRDARIVAASRDVSLAEYISDLIRPLVARDLDALQQELARRSGGSGPKPRAKAKGDS